MTQAQSTSLFAFINQVKPTLGHRQKTIYEAFGHRQKTIYEALGTRESFTNTEMAAWLGWPINTITPRMGELRKIGLVRNAGVRKCKVTGRNVMSWEIGKII